MQVLIIPVERPNAGRGSIPGTQSDWNTNMARVKAAWEASSFGTITISYTFAAKVTIGGSSGTNDPDEIRRQTLPQLSSDQPSVHWWTYDVVFYYIWPDTIQLTTSMGEMFVGGGNLGPTYPDTYGRTTPSSVLHELGHTMGLNHAGAFTGNPFTLAGLATVEDSQGTQEQYGDSYDPMSGGDIMVQANTFQRYRLGWMSGRTTQVTSGGNYTLDPRTTVSASNPQALIVNGQSGMEYWIEYVKRGADEAHDSALDGLSGGITNPAGVNIRVRGYRPSSSSDPLAIASWLIHQGGYADATPQFSAGQSFSDPGTGTRLGVSVTSAGTTAVVNITNPVAPSVVAPVNFTRPGAVSNLTAAISGTNTVLNWTLPAGATGTTYIYRDGSLLSSVAPGVHTYSDPSTLPHNYAVQTSTTVGVNSPMSNLAGNMASTFVYYQSDGSKDTSPAKPNHAGAKGLAAAGSLFVYGGDVYDSGTDAEFVMFNNVYSDVLPNLCETAGNHDWKTANEQGYVNYWGARQPPASKTVINNNQGTTIADHHHYQQNLGNGWLGIFIDSGNATASQPLTTFALNLIDGWITAHGSRNIIIFTHWGRLSRGKHGDNPSIDPLWQKCFDSTGAPRVAAWMSGHNHNMTIYKPRAKDLTVSTNGISNGIQIFCNGAGGAGHYPLSGTGVGGTVPDVFSDDQVFGFMKIEFADSSTVKFQNYSTGVNGSTSPATIGPLVSLNVGSGPPPVTITYDYKLDGAGSWTATTSGGADAFVSFSGLSAGVHTLQVREAVNGTPGAPSMYAWVQSASAPAIPTLDSELDGTGAAIPSGGHTSSTEMVVTFH